jgi:hypothetical protein
MGKSATGRHPRIPPVLDDAGDRRLTRLICVQG